ncbi:hypothetical protein EVAR_5009_1 [Eumeta japonica]|uniref:Uncharacterized protein n=1 Tax=Eumeta variegata TaxID=151549 RepID=A0A4C1SUN4_EUMVA|nr:hypothetical protein EVAR_5009_1 [Eumeta japonica]
MTILTTDRVLVDGKMLLQRWFPRTVELFHEERLRLETWRTGAAYHRWTDRGRENGAAPLVFPLSAHRLKATERVAMRVPSLDVQLLCADVHM